MALKERGIFHRCECLDKDYYHGDVLPEAFHDKSMAVYEFKGFKFNFSDVCLNPEIISFRDKKFTYVVEIAEKNEGCFISGYRVFSDNEEFLILAAPVFYDEGFKSKNLAIADVFKRLLVTYKLDADFCKKMICKYSTVQLSLFD